MSLFRCGPVINHADPESPSVINTDLRCHQLVGVSLFLLWGFFVQDFFLLWILCPFGLVSHEETFMYYINVL